MSDNTYNGWTNYATWNVPLWIGQDYGAYHAQQEWYENLTNMETEVTPGNAELFSIGLFGGEDTPDTKGNTFVGGRWQDINWQEIAEHWEEERLENEGE